MKLNANNWKVWSAFVAAPAEPEDYNEAAVERLIEKISPYIVDVRNVNPQFSAINRVKMIDFANHGEKARYDSAYIRYLEACSKIEASTSGAFAQLVEWLKFRQEAELIRAPFLAKEMHDAVVGGYAAVCACNFKATMAKVVAELHFKYGVPRSLISMIWGGSQTYANESGTLTTEDIKQLLSACMRGEEVDVRQLKRAKQQLLAQGAGLGNLPKELDLGPQNYDKSQKEIDRFQKGESLYCLFNFKSGGVGLSLHHSDEYTKEKVRRDKKTGYANTEDIPNIRTRQRCTILAPTYSAIELVQGLGRVPRITSLSDTTQVIVFYRGTIEVAVASIVSQKLRCLKKVVRKRETWETVILNQPKEIASEVINEEGVSGNEILEADNIEDDEEDNNET